LIVDYRKHQMIKTPTRALLDFFINGALLKCFVIDFYVFFPYVIYTMDIAHPLDIQMKMLSFFILKNIKYRRHRALKLIR